LCEASRFNIITFRKRSKPEPMSSSDAKPGDATAAAPAAGRGYQGKRPFSRPGGFQRNNNNPSSNIASIKQPKFDGKEECLKGHIYDCADARQSDQFVRTTMEIAEYVGRMYKNGTIIMTILKAEDPVLETPPEPKKDATTAQLRVWEKKIDALVKREENVADGVNTLYPVWGQCSDAMRSKVKAVPEFRQVEASTNGLALIKLIRSMAFNFQTKNSLFHSLHELTRLFFTCAQTKNMTVDSYLELFTNRIDVINQCGGEIGIGKGLKKIVAALLGIEFDEELMSDDDIKKMNKVAMDRFLGTAFLLGADKVQYSRLEENMENEFLQGIDKYPKSVDDAYSLLIGWKHEKVRVAGSDQDPRMMVCRSPMLPPLLPQQRQLNRQKKSA
jgi:hypothetical protein